MPTGLTRRTRRKVVQMALEMRLIHQLGIEIEIDEIIQSVKIHLGYDSGHIWWYSIDESISI